MLRRSQFYPLIYVTIGMCHRWNVPPLASEAGCGFSTLLLRGLLSIELIAFCLRNIPFSRAEFKGCQNREVAGSLHHQKLLLWGQARGSRCFFGEGPGISTQICLSHLCPRWHLVFIPSEVSLRTPSSCSSDPLLIRSIPSVSSLERMDMCRFSDGIIWRLYKSGPSSCDIPFIRKQKMAGLSSSHSLSYVYCKKFLTGEAPRQAPWWHKPQPRELPGPARISGHYCSAGSMRNKAALASEPQVSWGG